LNAAGLGVTEDDDETTESTGVLRDFWLFLNLSVSNASFYEMTQVVSETKKQKKSENLMQTTNSSCCFLSMRGHRRQRKGVNVWLVLPRQ
jgi:hypothetical protein